MQPSLQVAYSSNLLLPFLDSNSTHTFITKIFVDKIGVPIEDLGYYLVVSTPAKVVITTRVV